MHGIEHGKASEPWASFLVLVGSLCVSSAHRGVDWLLSVLKMDFASRSVCVAGKLQICSGGNEHPSSLP